MRDLTTMFVTVKISNDNLRLQGSKVYICVYQNTIVVKRGCKKNKGYLNKYPWRN